MYIKALIRKIIKRIVAVGIDPTDGIIYHGLQRPNFTIGAHSYIPIGWIFIAGIQKSTSQ